MSKDTELDRLKAAQETAWKRRQDVLSVKDSKNKEQSRLFEQMQSVRHRRTAARDEMNREFERLQSARSANDRAWDDAKRLGSSNDARIDSLKREANNAAANMREAFARADAAFNGGDKASAPGHSAEGRRYKEMAKSLNAQKAALISENQAAFERARSYGRTDSSSYKAARVRFESVKSECEAAEARWKSAKAEFDRAKAQFDSAKADHQRAEEAFQSRLKIVKGENQRRKDDKKSLAARAGVPYAYRDNCFVKTEPDGTVNIYFGGLGEPAGPGHGHYAMDASGKVTYKRDPYDPHGSQNFTDQQERQRSRREATTRSMAQLAIERWSREQTTSRKVQHEDDEFKVSVKSGFDRSHDRVVTDVVVADKLNKDEHFHLVIDEMGRELFADWQANAGR
jgi:hypothetical protein